MCTGTCAVQFGLASQSEAPYLTAAFPRRVLHTSEEGQTAALLSTLPSVSAVCSSGILWSTGAIHAEAPFEVLCAERVLFAFCSEASGHTAAGHVRSIKEHESEKIRGGGRRRGVDVSTQWISQSVNSRLNPVKEGAALLNLTGKNYVA